MSTWAAVRPGPRAVSVSRRASIVRRLAASLYEVLLLGALAVLVEFALLPILGTPSGRPEGGAIPLLSPVAQEVSFACLFAVLGAYCVWGWSEGRRTLPMKAWRIALESDSGSGARPSIAALRYVAGWIGPALAIAAYVVLRPSGHGGWAGVLLAVNYAWILVNTDRQFLHDRIAGTRLVAR